MAEETKVKRAVMKVPKARAKKAELVANQLVAMAEEFEIVDVESLDLAVAFMNGPVTIYQKEVVTFTEEARANTFSAWKAVTNLIKKLADPGDRAFEIISGKVSDFHTAERMRIATEQAEARARLEAEEAEFQRKADEEDALLEERRAALNRDIEARNSAESAAPAEPVQPVPPVPSLVRQYQYPVTSPHTREEPPKTKGIATSVVFTAQIVDRKLFLEACILGSVPREAGILTVVPSKLNKWVTDTQKAAVDPDIDWALFGIEVKEDTRVRRTGK